MADGVTGHGIDAIRARCDAATEGPWSVYGGDLWSGVTADELQRADDLYAQPDVAFSDEAEDIIERSDHLFHGDVKRIEDAEFIAHAREDVPALLAALADAEQRAAAGEAAIRTARIALQTNVRWPIEEGSGNSITWREAILRVDAILAAALAAGPQPGQKCEHGEDGPHDYDDGSYYAPSVTYCPGPQSEQEKP